MLRAINQLGLQLLKPSARDSPRSPRPPGALGVVPRVPFAPRAPSGDRHRPASAMQARILLSWSSNPWESISSPMAVKPSTSASELLGLPETTPLRGVQGRFACLCHRFAVSACEFTQPRIVESETPGPLRARAASELPQQSGTAGVTPCPSPLFPFASESPPPPGRTKRGSNTHPRYCEQPPPGQ